MCTCNGPYCIFRINALNRSGLHARVPPILDPGVASTQMGQIASVRIGQYKHSGLSACLENIACVIFKREFNIQLLLQFAMFTYLVTCKMPFCLSSDKFYNAPSNFCNCCPSPIFQNHMQILQ